jgi:serine/threonine protein kinase
MKNTVFKENEIITKFNHVNVIFVFDIIEDSDNYYIVMEYCKSGELFDYIVEKQHLDEDEASIFFYQLINGVEYIHSLGVAHRDLKPENLLLTEKKILKIIDFGLSHEFNGEDFLKTKCGSPSYAAPEIIKGLPYDGFKTDIWCCGIILYAMVCGYLPFEGENNKILFRNIVECKPEIPDNLSEETQDLISAILRPDPDDRITIDEIKKHEFYLRGKELCDIDYPKLQRMLNRKRQNMSNNNSNMNNNMDKGIDDIEFINQKINITIDNDENLQYDEIMKINKHNNNKNKENKKSKDIAEDNKTENNDIIIKSFNEISVSKITNNTFNEKIHFYLNKKK